MEIYFKLPPSEVAIQGCHLLNTNNHELAHMTLLQVIQQILSGAFLWLRVDKYGFFLFVFCLLSSVMMPGILSILSQTWNKQRQNN